MGHLLGGCMVRLMAAAPRAPAPVAGHCRRFKHRSGSVSGSWCTQGFVWALQASLAGMGFDSKHDFAPPSVLLGFLLCPWTWSIFFWWDPAFSLMNSMKRQKDRTLKDELPRSVGAQYATGDQWRNNSRKKRQSQSENNAQLWMWLAYGNKVQCCKEQCCIGTWNVRSMNQGKLEVVKQEMAKVNIDV